MNKNLNTTIKAVRRFNTPTFWPKDLHKGMTLKASIEALRLAGKLSFGRDMGLKAWLTDGTVLCVRNSRYPAGGEEYWSQRIVLVAPSRYGEQVVKTFRW